jgi:hypothetical protein
LLKCRPILVIAQLPVMFAELLNAAFSCIIIFTFYACAVRLAACIDCDFKFQLLSLNACDQAMDLLEPVKKVRRFALS